MIEPRFTVSSRTVARSTDGAAGSMRASATETATRTSAATAARPAWRSAFAFQDGGVAGDIGHGSVPVKTQRLCHVGRAVSGPFRAQFQAGHRRETAGCPVLGRRCPAAAPHALDSKRQGGGVVVEPLARPRRARRRTAARPATAATQGPMAHQRVHEPVVAEFAQTAADPGLDEAVGEEQQPIAGGERIRARCRRWRCRRCRRPPAGVETAHGAVGANEDRAVVARVAEAGCASRASSTATNEGDEPAMGALPAQRRIDARHGLVRRGVVGRGTARAPWPAGSTRAARRESLSADVADAKRQAVVAEREDVVVVAAERRTRVPSARRGCSRQRRAATTAAARAVSLARRASRAPRPHGPPGVARVRNLLPQHLHQRLVAPRFGHIPAGAAPHGFHGGLDVGPAGHRDERQVGLGGVDVGNEVEAFGARSRVARIVEVHHAPRRTPVRRAARAPRPPTRRPCVSKPAERSSSRSAAMTSGWSSATRTGRGMSSMRPSASSGVPGTGGAVESPF